MNDSATVVRTTSKWVDRAQVIALLLMAVALTACVFIIAQLRDDAATAADLARVIAADAAEERNQNYESIQDLRRQVSTTRQTTTQAIDLVDCYEAYSRAVDRASDLKDSRLGAVLAAAGDVIVGTPLLDAIALFNETTDRYAEATQASAAAVAVRDVWIAAGRPLPCPIE